MAEDADHINQSYLLRCRLVAAAAAETPAIWRFELREVSAESLSFRFSDLEGLKDFLAIKLINMAAGVKQNRRDGDKGKGGDLLSDFDSSN